MGLTWLAGVILESTFYSLKAMAWSGIWMPFERFESARTLESTGLPVLVLHGTADETSPFWHGAHLYARATGKKSKLFVEGAGHDNLQSFAGVAWGDAIRTFARDLPRPASRFKGTVRLSTAQPADAAVQDICHVDRG